MSLALTSGLQIASREVVGIPKRLESTLGNALIVGEDKTAKLKTGRYFPYDFGEMVSAVGQLNFAVHACKLRPIVIMENCVVECPLGIQLSSFLRKFYIAEFSLPLKVGVSVARKGIDLALKQFREIDGGPPLTLREQQFAVYRAYLQVPQTLVVTRHIVSGGARSYLKKYSSAQLSKAGRDPDNQSIIYSAYLA